VKTGGMTSERRFRLQSKKQWRDINTGLCGCSWIDGCKAQF